MLEKTAAENARDLLQRIRFSDDQINWLEGRLRTPAQMTREEYDHINGNMTMYAVEIFDLSRQAVRAAQDSGDLNLIAESEQIADQSKQWVDDQISVAAANNDVESVRPFFDAAKGDNNWLDEQLHKAVRRENQPLVDLCLEAGARVDRYSVAVDAGDQNATKKGVAFLQQRYQAIEKYEQETKKAIQKGDIKTFVKTQQKMGRNPLYEAMRLKTEFADNPKMKANSQAFMLKLYDKTSLADIKKAYDTAKDNGDVKSMALLKEMGKLKMVDQNGVNNYIDAEQRDILPSWIKSGSASAAKSTAPAKPTGPQVDTDPGQRSSASPGFK